MAALFLPNSEPPRTPIPRRFLSHFHDEHSETENVYHDYPAPSNPA